MKVLVVIVGAILALATIKAHPQVFGAACTFGPGYWCDTLEKAKECNALVHCRTKVWKANAPARKVTKRQVAKYGADKCRSTWTCASFASARECGTLEYCQKNVWLGRAPK